MNRPSENRAPILGQVLFQESEIKYRVVQLAEEINADFCTKNPFVMVGVLKGASFFTADLARHITSPLKLSFVTVSSYGQLTVSTSGPRLLQALDFNPEGCDVLLVEDLIDTGKTLNFLHDMLLERGASSVESCVLLDLKKDISYRHYIPKYIGFETDANWVSGYGIDCKEMYRNVPSIHRIENI